MKWEDVELRLRDVAKRAGLGHAPTPVVLALVVLSVLAIVWASWHWWPRAEPDAFVAGKAHAAGDGGEERDAPATATVGAGDVNADQPAELFVHVAGAVRRPGVYRLSPDARVMDAVNAAGGALPDAVLAGINLARAVADGEQIIVPDEDTPAAPGGSSGGQGVGASAGAAGGPVSGPVDINTASAAQLEELPGVGPSTAQKIIAERESNGPFASVEDLGRVSGIGPKKLEGLKDAAIVR